MYDTFQEHCDYEANARYDSVREAYAATELDPYYEEYCDYCFDCEDQGETPLAFAEWKAGLKPINSTPPALTWSDETDFPF